jgi:hypothetical protein
MLEIQHFRRKSFPVDGVQVTAENMSDVSRWCDGQIHQDKTEENPTDHPNYIKVRVHNPLTERQTKAYVGDWVLYAGKGYKVYTERGLKKSFEEDDEPDEQNVFSDQGAGSPNLGHGRSGRKNPGGTAG